MRLAFALGLCFALCAAGDAAALTIYDVQYSLPPDYISPYYGQVVDVSGGVVTKVFVGSKTKIAIQDPRLGNAWAGVQVVFNDPAGAEGIAVGDQVDFYQVLVDEYRGNTQLVIQDGSDFTVMSSGNVVLPLTVSPAEIPYPVNHDFSEKYEFMLLRVEGVQVGQMDLGKASDNYELVNPEGVCWASDYANADLPPGGTYYVSPGDCFESVTGYLEQYLKPSEGWDYYQLLPRDAEDYVYGPSAADAATWGAVKGIFR